MDICSFLWSPSSTLYSEKEIDLLMLKTCSATEWASVIGFKGSKHAKAAAAAEYTVLRLTQCTSMSTFICVLVYLY